ncbi:MAG: PepSY-like domain-containing protein [Bacteroidales bacterium]|jgi:hypothetical protein|nr:PepSY-like domain-containing protein [Bacteroidales bacterium]
MKIFRILFIVAALQLTFSINSSLQAQKLKPDDVPGSISQSFASEYPSAKLMSWSLENETYVASFKDDGSDGKAFFKNDGTWIKTTYDIPKTEIPSNIMDYVTKNYPNYEISVCNLQETPTVRTHYYLEVRFPEVGSKDTPSILTFNYIGELLKREDPAGFVLRTDAPGQTTPAEPAEKPQKPKKEPVKKNTEVTDNQTQTDEKPAPKEETVPAKEKKAPKENKKDKKNIEAPADPWAKYAVNESTVPVIVAKMLKKKAPKTTDLNWFLIGETYVAKCLVRELPTEVYISKKGAWKKTISYMLEERVSSVFKKHLDTYYKGYKFNKAYKELRADKKNKVYIEFYEKKNWKKKIPTGVLFDDKTRKLIRNVDPNFETFEDPDLFVNTEPTAEDAEASIEELPEAIKSYISSNYPSYKYRDYTTETDADLGEIYRIEIESTGTSYIILYFDNTGKFLKKEVEDGVQTVKSYGDYEEIEVPEKVINAFKAKYPRVESAVWDEDLNENYNVQFTGTRGKEMCVISPNGEILEVLYFLEIAKLIPEIEQYLSTNYKGCDILQYYSVKKGDQNLYKLVIMPKKSKFAKYLWFTSAGVFEMEEK